MFFGQEEVTSEVISDFKIAIQSMNLERIKQLLQTHDRSIVNRVESQTRQPSLFFAATLSDHEDCYEIMKLLIEHGANAKFQDNYQQTVLFYVCKDGKEKALDLLLDEGLSLDDQDIFGQTPIYYAAKQDRLNIIHKLINSKVNLNNLDKIASQTPLFYAAKEGHLEMCKVLIENGCDLSIQDSNGKMASYFARKNTKQEVYDYLTAQYQLLKEQKKLQEGESRQPSEKAHKAKKKKEVQHNVSVYKLYRSDNLGNANEVTVEEFEELMALHPNIKAMLDNPEEIDMGQIEQIKAKNSWIKSAIKVLTTCSKTKGGYYFHDPVDPAKFGIDDYFDIIKEPMDFGTIRKKLNHNVYEGIDDFVRDMKLVFSNCLKYNGEENMISKYAIEIRNIFEENMKQIGHPV